MEYIRLNIDHPAVGCGWRAFAIEKIGYKWAYLCEPSTGARIHIPKEEMRYGRPVNAPRWHKIARQLRRNGRRALAEQAKTEN